MIYIPVCDNSPQPGIEVTLSNPFISSISFLYMVKPSTTSIVEDFSHVLGNPINILDVIFDPPKLTTCMTFCLVQFSLGVCAAGKYFLGRLSVIQLSRKDLNG